MKMSLMLPAHPDGRPEALFTAAETVAFARAAEGAGFGAVHVTDHPCPPTEWIEDGGHHALDPFVVLALVAAATTTLRLHTHLVVAGYRHPLLLAHSAASLDLVSDGRVDLGIGVGYLEGEFDVLDASYAERGAVCDHVLDTLRARWRTPPDAGRRGVLRPLPVQPGGPRVWVGGNSAPARRRAVAFGDGWAPFPARARGARITGTAQLADAADLARAVEDLRAVMREQGRDRPLEVLFAPLGARTHSHALLPDRIVEGAAEMAAAGASTLTVALPCPSPSAFLEAIDLYGREVVPPVESIVGRPVHPDDPRPPSSAQRRSNPA